MLNETYCDWGEPEVILGESYKFMGKITEKHGKCVFLAENILTI